MDPLLVNLFLVFFKIIGALIVLMSLKMFKSSFNKKDWGELAIGVLCFLMGGYIIVFTSIFILFDDFNNFESTYVWTYVISIPSIYFLYFYFPKTKFYKNNFKIRKKPPKPIYKSENDAPSIFTWIGALISDIVMIIVYLALFLGFIYLLVKLVKYFWYV